MEEASILLLSIDALSLIASYLPARDMRLICVTSPKIWNKLCLGSGIKVTIARREQVRGRWLQDLKSLESLELLPLTNWFYSPSNYSWAFDLSKNVKYLTMGHHAALAMWLRKPPKDSNAGHVHVLSITPVRATT